MKLASLADGSPDGRLIVVSKDLSHAAPADHIAPNLLAAVEQWRTTETALRGLADAVAAGTAPGLAPLDLTLLDAPLPRTWQWLDGSVFKTHVDLGTEAYQIPEVWFDGPLMYQGMSHRFLSPQAEARFPSADDGIDFEGEFVVVTTEVAMGADREAAQQAIILVGQLNDWSLRNQGRDEMKRGYGWIHAKPACSMAPVLVTPDELGPAWRDCRCGLDLEIHRNGEQFGRANGREMAFGFEELVVHAAYSRDLPAGTLIGSGTVANASYREVGSSCILERRAIETLDRAASQTTFLQDGERVRMAAKASDGTTPFGVIDCTVRVG